MFGSKFAFAVALLAQAWFDLVICEENAEEHVVTLTKANFDEFVKGEALTVVDFYASWCGHCKRLAPEFEAAAKALKEDGIKLAKVEVTVEQELGEQFDIKSYPTLKVFRHGVPEEYAGGRTTDTIVQYIRRMTGPAVEKATSMDEIKKQAKNIPVAFIGKFSSEDSPAFATYKSVAEKFRVSGKFFMLIEDKADETVLALRAEEGMTSPIKVTTPEALEEFITTEKFPLFGTIDTSNYAGYFSSGLDMMWFIGTKADFDTAAPAIRQVAANFRSKALFVWLDAGAFKDHAQSALGVSSVPALVAQIKENRYMYDEADFKSADKIKTFLTAAFDGKIERHLMSEPIPEPQTGDPVTTVVGLNLEKTVFSETKDVFLEIYAPWCGHCKQFEKTYKEFAEFIKKYPNVVVAKMDGTKNESPVSNIAWQGFPTIFFVKAGSKEPVMYDGPRTMQSLVEYLKKHGSQEIDDADIPKSDETAKDEL